MVLINIDQLSDAELKYIAKQERLEDWDSLDREDLIETLEELYDDDSIPAVDKNKKFVKSLTDINSDVLQLPGVEPLPKSFNDNEIHFILSDSSWAYVFWGFDVITKNKIDELKAEVFIKVTVLKDADHPQESYEIKVGNEDDSWNIELPWPGRIYKMTLIIRSSEGEEEIAFSEYEETPMHWTDKNSDVLSDSEQFELLASSLISKDGSCVDCRNVRKIVSQYRGDTE